MGVLDSIRSNVLTTFKADTTDVKRKMRDLTGVEKQRHAALAKQLEDQNGRLERQMKTLGKVAAAVGVVAGAYVALKGSIEAYAEDAKLRHASHGADLDKLRRTTKGLVSDVDLMKFAARGLNSDFKLTGKEIDNVANLAMKLHRKGYDLAEVMRDLGKATAEGGTEEIQKYGEILRKSKDGAMVPFAKGVEGLEALLKRAGETTRDVANLQGDDATRASIRLQNAWRNLKVEVGGLVEGIHGLANALAAVAEAARGAIQWVRRFHEETDPDKPKEHQLRHEEKLQWQIVEWKAAKSLVAQQVLRGSSKDTREQRLAKFDLWISTAEREIEISRGERERSERLARLQKGLEGVSARGFPPEVEQWMAAMRARDALRGMDRGDDGTGRGGRAVQAPGGASFWELARSAAAPWITRAGLGREQWEREQEAAARRQETATAMRHMFAPAPLTPGGFEWDPQRLRRERGERAEWWLTGEGPGGDTQSKAMQMLGQSSTAAFQAMLSGSSAAFEAMVTGSESMATAFKKAMGQMVLSKASLLFATGIEQGILALVQLAYGNMPGAATHGKASAAAFGGAAALAIIARALGVQDQVPGAQARAGAGGAAGARGGGGGNVTRNIFIGAGFEFLSGRERAAVMRRTIRRATAEEGESAGRPE